MNRWKGIKVAFHQGDNFSMSIPECRKESGKIPIHVESRNRFESTSHCAFGHENICNPFSRANFLLRRCPPVKNPRAPLVERWKRRTDPRRSHNSRENCRLFAESGFSKNARGSVAFLSIALEMLPSSQSPFSRLQFNLETTVSGTTKRTMWMKNRFQLNNVANWKIAGVFRWTINYIAW